jgi:ribosomal RNA-processing protein 12
VLFCNRALISPCPSNLTQDVVTKLTGELLLCLKDSKAKTRDSAYRVLISLAKATGDLVGFLRIVTAALASETSHMRSAAVSASSRLVFEFAREDTNMQQALPSLLQTVLVLFNEQSREVIKSAVGFVRVCVAAIPPDQLQQMLPDILGALLKYHKVKDRFRPKIKIIIKKLVKLYGYDTLMPFVPKTETRLLVHMRKLEERAARRKAANRAEGAPETQDYDEMVGSDEYDSDDGRTLMTGATGLTRRTKMSAVSAAKSSGGKSRASTVHSTKQAAEGRRLPSEKDGEVLNILSVKEKNVRFAESNDSDSDDDGVMEFDDFGRLVVTDEADAVGDDNEVVGELDERNMSRNKRRKLGGDSESVKTGASSSKKKGKGSKVRQLGAAYKSRKAGGDVKKKGQKFEPYAFVPLDGRSYSKKNRRRKRS